MSENTAVEVVDWFGKWLDNGVTKELIEESPEWIARQNEIRDEENKPKPPSPIDVLGKRMVALEGDLMVSEVINKTMGSQLVAREIEIFKLQSLNDKLGQQVVQMDLRLMKGGIL